MIRGQPAALKEVLLADSRKQLDSLLFLDQIPAQIQGGQGLPGVFPRGALLEVQGLGDLEKPGVALPVDHVQMRHIDRPLFPQLQHLVKKVTCLDRLHLPGVADQMDFCLPPLVLDILHDLQQMSRLFGPDHARLVQPQNDLLGFIDEVFLTCSLQPWQGRLFPLQGNLAPCRGIQEAVNTETGPAARPLHLQGSLPGIGDVVRLVILPLRLKHIGIEVLDESGSESFPGPGFPLRHQDTTGSQQLIENLLRLSVCQTDALLLLPHFLVGGDFLPGGQGVELLKPLYHLQVPGLKPEHPGCRVVRPPLLLSQPLHHIGPGVDGEIQFPHAVPAARHQHGLVQEPRPVQYRLPVDEPFRREPHHLGRGIFR